MSQPQKIMVGGVWRPLMTSARQPAKECCCGVACNVIPVSLCGSTTNECSWYPEFTDPGADPPVEVSCPPKYYRTKTVQTTATSTSGLLEEHLDEGEWGVYKNSTETYNYDYTVINTIDPDGEEECQTTTACTGTSSSSYEGVWGPLSGLEGEIPDTTNSSYTLNPECCWQGESISTAFDYSGSIIYRFLCDGSPDDWYFAGDDEIYSFGGGAAAPSPPNLSLPGTTYTEDISYTTTSKTTTINWSRSYIEEPTESSRNTYTDSGEYIVIETLSDEATLFEELANLVCNTEECDPEDEEEPNCEPCCTDRGETISGLKYKDNPEGCIVPGSAVISWDLSPCDTSGDRSGQGVKLALWFKDLVPGTVYKATVTYKRCEFGADEEANPIEPVGCVALGCGDSDPETWPTITDEVIFTAQHWAEILAHNCVFCPILRKRCELEDEAAAWNAANPEAVVPRTVECTEGGFTIPTEKNTYTWFHSCSLEIYEGPPGEEA